LSRISSNVKNLALSFFASSSDMPDKTLFELPILWIWRLGAISEGMCHDLTIPSCVFALAPFWNREPLSELFTEFLALLPRQLFFETGSLPSVVWLPVLSFFSSFAI
jgi:hypothetical protein